MTSQEGTANCDIRGTFQRDPDVIDSSAQAQDAGDQRDGTPESADRDTRRGAAPSVSIG